MHSLVMHPVPSTTEKTLVTASETTALTSYPKDAGPLRDRSIKSSFWYQWRSVISTTSILTCWVLGVLSAPRIAEDSLLAWVLNGSGWTLFATGIAVRMWATLYIGGRKAKGVIEHGPYSVCRNPLYWGTLFVLLSQVLMFKSGIFALGTVLPILIYLLGVVPAEEAYLTQKLGEDYLKYCARVPRWMPCWRNYCSPDVIDVDLQGLRAEALRILGWVWLPFLIQTICQLRQQPGWYAPLNLM